MYAAKAVAHTKIHIIIRLHKLCTCIRAQTSRLFLKGRANDEERTKEDEQNDVVRPCRITGVPGECQRQAPREHREKTLMHVVELGCHNSQMRANLS